MSATLDRPLRPELPELSPRLARLPVSSRGYPVPWFVAWIDGEPDFRVVGPGRVEDALRDRLCWTCGEPLGRYAAYVVGPMCAVNRTSAEPPSHADCATFSAKACPFLTRPHARRREGGLPEERVEPAGIMLRRNPGVALVWHIEGKLRLRRAPNGLLFDLGEPVGLEWWREGRPATRAEVEESIESGLPALAELADAQGPIARRALDRALDRARLLLPV